MTITEYRDHPALNFSLAKNLLKSPAHFKAAQDEEREETNAMQIGTLVHAMVLEGKNLLDLYAIKPEGMSFATKEGKAWRDAQTLPVLKEEDANMIPRVAQAVADNQDAAKVLRMCQMRETPMFATIMGVECKCLLDNHGKVGAEWAINDLKTCQDASPREFAKDVYSRDYDLQMVWYQTILASVHKLDAPPFWTWTAVEKKAPFANAIYTGEEWEESGLRKMEIVLTRYKTCMETGEWPMPYRGFVKLDRLSWMKGGDQ